MLRTYPFECISALNIRWLTISIILRRDSTNVVRIAHIIVLYQRIPNWLEYDFCCILINHIHGISWLHINSSLGWRTTFLSMSLRYIFTPSPVITIAYITATHNCALFGERRLLMRNNNKLKLDCSIDFMCFIVTVMCVIGTVKNLSRNV